MLYTSLNQNTVSFIKDLVRVFLLWLFGFVLVWGFWFFWFVFFLIQAQQDFENLRLRKIKEYELTENQLPTETLESG